MRFKGISKLSGWEIKEQDHAFFVYENSQYKTTFGELKWAISYVCRYNGVPVIELDSLEKHFKFSSYDSDLNEFSHNHCMLEGRYKI